MIEDIITFGGCFLIILIILLCFITDYNSSELEHCMRYYKDYDYCQRYERKDV